MKKRENNVSQPKNNPRLTSLHMEITGNREVILEGNRGILEYTGESIKLNAGKCIIAFCGRGLHIQCMNECDVVVRGFITSIEYLI